MLEVNLLGTGGMVPLPDRHLTALLVRYQGLSVLIDCGEGTQVAIRKAGLGFKAIGLICLTHFHADHIAGLPGLLLTIGNSGRAEPLTIIGPPHVGQVVDCLRIIAPQLPFPVEYGEIRQPGPVFQVEYLTVSAFPVKHWIPCFAYKLELARQPRFDADRARALEIPVRFWSLLQRGESVATGGRSFAPADVLGPPRRGLKLCYTTDLRPTEGLPAFAAEADLLVCEGMYGDPEQADKAVEHRHCLFSEAAAIAREAKARELWLTHFSPSLVEPEQYLHHATALFPNTKIGQTHTLLRFPD